MNNYYDSTKTIVIDFADYLWKLVMQWKALLIVCIFMALLVPGTKYINDMRAYDNAIRNQSSSQADSSLSADERIEKALSQLPEDQRGDVLFVMQQREFIKLQKDHLANSILLSSDPTCQRRIRYKLYVVKKEDIDIPSLCNAYKSHLRSTEFLCDLRDVISPDSRLEYINELLSFETNENPDSNETPDSNASAALFSVDIIVPEDTDLDALTEVFDSTISDAHNELSTSMGEHSITRINTEDVHIYNKDAVELRYDITSSTNTLITSLSTVMNRLSAEQKAVLESITTIKLSEDASELSSGKSDDGSDLSGTQRSEREKIIKPGFSKKYALFGFVLGAFLYAGIYLAVIAVKRIISSSRIAQNITCTRLLGEIYSFGKRKGFLGLFSSVVVARWRYKDKLDSDKQIKALASTMDAVITHCDANQVALLRTGIGPSFDGLLDTVIDSCRAHGIKASIKVLDSDKMDEKDLTKVKNAIYVVCGDSKIGNVEKNMSLCDDYDVNMLGTIYLEHL